MVHLTKVAPVLHCPTSELFRVYPHLYLLVRFIVEITSIYVYTAIGLSLIHLHIKPLLVTAVVFTSSAFQPKWTVG